jgi:zinc metalloprotease ZmpB
LILRRIFIALLALSACALVPAAGAANPPSGSSTGTGTVFVPNPVADLGVGSFAFRESLTDQKDADYPALAPAYHDVALTNLDGSGYLRGDFAYVVNEVGDSAYSPTNTFRYHRDDDRFEQVMAYFWITEAQKYIQSLGFGLWRRPINLEPQDVRINQWGQDNSFETDHPKDELRFGKGGVDDAEDAEIVLHEYGHAMHVSQSPTFYSSIEAGSIGEGFADYWAVTVSDVVSKRLGVAVDPDIACVGEWDATYYDPTIPYCLRRVDTNLHYPEDLTEKVHHDGQIWSRALWDIRKGLGNLTADTIVLEAQFDFPGTTMPDLARTTVETAQRLYGAKAAKTVEAAFEARGIL